MRREAIGVVLITAICGVSNAAAQTDDYPRMAAIGEYLMERDAEIRLARTAAPESISGDATILVLGRQGYEQAVEGTNGFVCMVARSWMAAFDWSEFWNPKVRAPDCMNPQAARFVVPVARLRSRMLMAGRSREEVRSALEAAFERRELPAVEHGAIEYMMSKGAYLTDEGEHNAPHLMFLTAGLQPGDWGAGVAGSPVMAAPYWFFGPSAPVQPERLPPVLVFLVGVGEWSDGKPAAR